MKSTAFLFSIAISAIACSSPATNTVKTDSTVTTDSSKVTTAAKSPHGITSMCFERTEGKNNLDSTYVQLVVKGKTVSGEMNWLPFQKDVRKGLLTGTISGDTIRAMWTFKQEGMTDSMQVKFKLDGSQLAQKPLKADAKTGRQYTDEAAGYTIMYKPSAGQRP